MRIWMVDWTYVFAEPEQARLILNNADLFPKKIRYEMKGTLGESFMGLEHIAGANGDAWRRLRKILSPPFRKHFQVDVFQQCAEELCDHWEYMLAKNKHKNRHGKAVMDIEVHAWMQRLTLDVLGRGLLGYDFQAMQDVQNEKFKVYQVVLRTIQTGFFYFA